MSLSTWPPTYAMRPDRIPCLCDTGISQPQCLSGHEYVRFIAFPRTALVVGYRPSYAAGVTGSGLTFQHLTHRRLTLRVAAATECHIVRPDPSAPPPPPAPPPPRGGGGGGGGGGLCPARHGARRGST